MRSSSMIFSVTRWAENFTENIPKTINSVLLLRILNKHMYAHVQCSGISGCLSAKLGKYHSNYDRSCCYVCSVNCLSFSAAELSLPCMFRDELSCSDLLQGRAHSLW